VASGILVGLTSRSTEDLSSEMLMLQTCRVPDRLRSDFELPCPSDRPSTERSICFESKTAAGNLESNTCCSVHSLSDGPIGNATAKFTELGWPLGNFSSTVACRASIETRSKIHNAAVSKAVRICRRQYREISEKSVSLARSYVEVG
jgi:hypothetical protein